MKHRSLYIIPAALIISGCRTARHADSVVSDSIVTRMSIAAEIRCMRSDSLEFSTLVTADSIVWKWSDSLTTRRTVAYGVRADRRLHTGSAETVTESTVTDSATASVSHAEHHTEIKATATPLRWIWGVALAVVLLPALLRYMRRR
ncbi:MAG: hypothetical protein K2J17_06470 [Paramuribaculum sp.]|nr:hypothetical protein [Paramuribaculum sp.]